MSSKKTKSELEDEAVRKKVDKMYENYGIDPHGTDDTDLTRVYGFYKANREQLERDYKKSKKHADQFSDEETL